MSSSQFNQVSQSQQENPRVKEEEEKEKEQSHQPNKSGLSQSSIDIDDVPLLCLKQIVEPKDANDKKIKTKRTNKSSDNGVIPEALVQDTSHVLVVKAWKAGEHKQREQHNYSSNLGKAYLKSLLNDHILTSVPLQIFLSDKETVRRLPGQTILNAVIYGALLDLKTCHGPPSMFLYPSRAAIAKQSRMIPEKVVVQRIWMR